jgi:porphobilinogen synthase
MRKNEKLRSMVRETTLSGDCLVYPVFVKEMSEREVPIDAMPGISQFSVDGVLSEVEKTLDAGVPAILVFGIPENKDETGSGATTGTVSSNRLCGPSSAASATDILIITDDCMCE